MNFRRGARRSEKRLTSPPRHPGGLQDRVRKGPGARAEPLEGIVNDRQIRIELPL